MARQRPRERTVFLPWERQGALFGQGGLARVRPAIYATAVVLVCLWMAARERDRAGVRSTRATLLVARRAVDTYRADANGQCPKGWEELVTRGYLASQPRDAWGHTLALTCPSRHPNKSYDVSSDGPDGEPLGLDRVE